MNDGKSVINGSSNGMKLKISFKETDKLILPHNMEIISIETIRPGNLGIRPGNLGFILEIKVNNLAKSLEYISFFKDKNYIEQKQEDELILKINDLFTLKKEVV